MKESFPIFFSVAGYSSLENTVMIDNNNCNNSSHNFDKVNNNKNLILLVSQSPEVTYYVAYEFIKHIKIPFVIITVMNDYTFPLELMYVNSIKKIISHKHFKHWFATNKSIPNDNNFTSIPYGLNYWTLLKKDFFGEEIQTVTEQDNKLVNISKNSLRFTNRIPKIYANFHVKCTPHLNNQHTDLRHGNWRGRLHNVIPSDIIYFESNILPRTKSWEQFSLYSFVLSPLGNGLDCIRTYEALCLGCIVIIKKSDLNDNCLYSDLPVLIVNEYSEINKKLLKVTLELFSIKKFNYEKLYMNYWINLVNHKFT
jgi:hypothetical protein